MQLGFSLLPQTGNSLQDQPILQRRVDLKARLVQDAQADVPGDLPL